MHGHLYIYLSSVSMMLFMSELFKWETELTEKEKSQVGVIMLSRRGLNTSPEGKKEGDQIKNDEWQIPSGFTASEGEKKLSKKHLIVKKSMHAKENVSFCRC